MAGYRKQRTVYNLTFENHPGLEISAGSLTTGQTMDLWKARADTTPEGTEDMLRMFADSLQSWNLETEEGEPVPMDFKGLQTQELPFVLQLVDAWTTALAGTSAELGKDSTSGERSLEVSIPMEAL
jgi:hypothetical protein